MNKFSSTLMITATIALLSASHVSAATVNVDVRNIGHPAASLHFKANPMRPPVVPPHHIPTASGIHPITVPNGAYASFWINVGGAHSMVVMCYEHLEGRVPIPKPINLNRDDKTFDLMFTYDHSNPYGPPRASCVAKGG